MPQRNFINKFTIAITFLLIQSLYSQIGIGTFGVYKYPGFQSSERHDIRFNGGIGYGFFVKHDLIKFESGKTFLRYLAKITNHTANLPDVVPDNESSDFKFSNLSLDMIYEFFVKNKNKYYTGVSINLLQTLSEGRFRATYAGSSVFPSIFMGWERNLAKGFDIFTEVRSGYGKTDKDAGPEEIPITGVSILVGLTMYISE